MWIKELPHDYLKKGSGAIYFNGLWNEGNVYVMDNHRVAAWCWLQSCSALQSYNFLHIDQHSDLLLDGIPNAWETYKRILNYPTLSLDDYLELRHPYSNFYAFRWDNYIRPMHKLFPHWFEQSYFAYTKTFDIKDHDKKCQSDEYKGFNGLANCLSNEELLELLSNIASDRTRKWIINLDIDYFFSQQIHCEGENLVSEFGQLLNECLRNAQVLTIALSPSCCRNNRSNISGWRNSIRVFNHIKEHVASLSNCEFSL